ncbi:MAG: hypothetical protein AAF531_21115 [Actinomycetota bacterium]
MAYPWATTRRNPSRLLILGFLAVGLAIAGGCGSGDDSASDAATSAAATPSDETADDGPADQGPEGEDPADEGPADDGTTSSSVTAAEPADQTATDGATAGELFPDVIAATAELSADGTWRFSATLSSPYDTPERYADGWRVVGPDGTVYGERPLGHDHQFEQPFTRSQSGIEIPDEVTEVTVQGRDQVSGWGGDTVQVMLER